MRWVAKSGRSPIGVDITAREIRAAQLSRMKDYWRIEALCTLPRTTPGSDIDAQQIRQLRDVLKRQGFKGKDIILAAPCEKVLTGIFDVPPKKSGAPILIMP